MTDRELLELAAKAAGYVIDEHARNGSAWAWVYPFGAKPDGDGDYPIFKWNPLHDDGDALRLAVKRNIGVRSHGSDHWQQPNVAVALWDVGEMGGRVVVESGDDPQRAIRRAIVRAAAQIGRAMP